METLFSTAPGFDQPLAVLKHCHDRIRKQLLTLEKLPAHLVQHGADKQAQQAAMAVLRYFQQAAPLHHDDEEIDLLPTLQASAQGVELLELERNIANILQQHKQMSLLWQRLHIDLVRITEGQSINFDQETLNEFRQLYQTHMQIEETQIAPLAAKILSVEQMQKIGKAMQQRRGIVSINELPV